MTAKKKAVKPPVSLEPAGTSIFVTTRDRELHFRLSPGYHVVDIRGNSLVVDSVILISPEDNLGEFTVTMGCGVPILIIATS